MIKKENSKILKGIIETLAAIFSEVEIKVNPKELTISAMHPSRICSLKVTMKKEEFNEFQISGGESKIGLNIEALDKVLKRANNDHLITLSFEEKDQKLKIRMSKEGSMRSKTFSLSILDIDTEEIPMDNLLQIEYDSSWKMNMDLLVEAVKDAEIYSEVMNIKAEEAKGLLFSSIGQIGEMEYDMGEEELIEANLHGVSSGDYSLAFLKPIVKMNSITETFEMSLKTAFPIKCILSILEGGTLSYFLAPRVEDAEFDDVEDVEEF